MIVTPDLPMLPRNGSQASAGAGRRPLLLPLHKRAMLHDIRDSLSHHVRQQQLQQQQQEVQQCSKDQSPSQKVEQKPATAKGASRLGYNQKALAEIRADLKGLEISEQSDAQTVNNTNGYCGVDSPVNDAVVQQLVEMGYGEVGIECEK